MAHASGEVEVGRDLSAELAGAVDQSEIDREERLLRPIAAELAHSA